MIRLQFPVRFGCFRVDCTACEDLTNRPFYCEGCEKDQPFHRFIGTMRKSIMNGLSTIGKRATGLRCEQCVCPPCLRCGERATEAVPAGQRYHGYYCAKCKGMPAPDMWLQKEKVCARCKVTKKLKEYPEKVQDKVWKTGQIQNKLHKCRQCAEDNCQPKERRKRCRQCGICKPLDEYPLAAREAVAKRQEICNGEHLCTNCQPKERLKRCRQCGKCKPLNEYSLAAREAVAKKQDICNGEHLCTNCKGQ